MVWKSSMGFRIGWHQAVLELRRKYTPLKILATFTGPVILFIAIRLGIINRIGGVGVFRWIACAYVGTALSINGLVTLSSTIIGDQEDGSLLRAKTIPSGFLAHIFAKVMILSTESAISITLMLATAQIAAKQWIMKPTLWMATLPLIMVLSIAVIAPLGLIAGGFSRKITDIIYICIIAYALIGISDLLVPPGFMPNWLTLIAKVFPFYWLGYLSRLSLLGPNSPLTLLPTLDWVLGCIILWSWLLIGLFLLPKAVRALSRRQSPSRSTYKPSALN